jgi:hypothetical protein
LGWAPGSIPTPSRVPPAFLSGLHRGGEAAAVLRGGLDAAVPSLRCESRRPHCVWGNRRNRRPGPIKTRTRVHLCRPTAWGSATAPSIRRPPCPMPPTIPRPRSSKLMERRCLSMRMASSNVRGANQPAVPSSGNAAGATSGPPAARRMMASEHDASIAANRNAAPGK